MPAEGNDARQLTDLSPSQRSTVSPNSSYVYPVRSLLSGIRPGTVQRHLGDIDAAASTDSSIPTLQRSFSSGDLVPGPQPLVPASLSTNRSPESEAPPTDCKRRRSHVPNYRDFIPGEDPLSQRTFSTARNISTSITHPSPPSDPQYTSGPVGEPVMYSKTDADDEQDRRAAHEARHPPQFSEVASQAFAEAVGSLLPADGGADEATQAHFSHSGIVHLAPISSNPPSQNASSQGSTRGRTSRSSGSGQEQVSVHLENLDVVQMPSTQGSRPASPIGASLITGSGSSLSSADASESERPHVAFRYTHIQDEKGHHLIVGREGKLTRCEDEPIRTPGAVQGFGVLIVLEEDDETGNLVVRQVSENSTELLGLSPQYLFTLDCFSQTLPDQQSNVLFDNIQYLSDTSLTPEEQAENLHVFMLSGWGEPGTADLASVSSDTQKRRSWSCWCAAHRPRMTAPANLAVNEQGTGNSRSGSNFENLIILEFELERDTYNPLYPPTVADDSSARSGVSSPSDASGASTSNSSGRTLVSSTTTSSDEQIITPENSTPSLVNSEQSMPLRFSGSSPTPSNEGSAYNFTGTNGWLPSPEDILESTTSRAKPILALERLRRTRNHSTESPTLPSLAELRRGPMRRRRGTGAVSMMDVFAVMAQINEQLGAAQDLDTFLKIVVGVLKDLTQFHRVLVYQFDEMWNGQVVAELVDWNQTHDLYRGLHFPAADIPAQARHLYCLNKVRLLYDRAQPTARLVVRSKRDLETPLDMTHCYLRAMSPIHLKYLENMGVRASMSVSIIAFGQLWGLVACHSYGPHGMRVSFPVRQMLRLLSQSISRNIERLSYAQRLHTRKLINTMTSEQHPSGYIVSNADDLLGLFDADYGVLVIGEGAKILGPNQHGQEILVVAEYLRLKQSDTIQVSQAVTQDYPDLQLSTGLEVIAGLLYVPLSAGGRDFIAFLRKGQPREVRWAGRPFNKEGEQKSVLEPRASFKVWSETVTGRCRAWSDEHLETAGVLALVYGKFIEVWRQKESALQTTKLTNILLSNASHEVRTPLNHIINYLELALNGTLDVETRENLSQSHAASKSLLFTINDLLDLTRLESGNETSFHEIFDLPRAIEEAIMLYRNEANRRGLRFDLNVSNCPRMVVGDVRKVRTVVANITANALKFTKQGGITVECHAFDEPVGLRSAENVAVEIVVADTGCGISSEKLECIFREFEQVESSLPKTNSEGLGLGLAVVARIVEQLGGQLRVDSRINEGSRFSFLLPLSTDPEGLSKSSESRSYSPDSQRPSNEAIAIRGDEINSLVEALSQHQINSQSFTPSGGTPALGSLPERPPSQSDTPLTSVSAEEELLQVKPRRSRNSSKLRHVDGPGTPVLVPPAIKRSSQSQTSPSPKVSGSRQSVSTSRSTRSDNGVGTKLRLLIVEDNDINRMILAKRLSIDGHNVVNTTNGVEGVEMVESDWEFDCILMDIQMPLLNGFEATERIRSLEKVRAEEIQRVSHKLNGRIPIFAVSASLFEDQHEELFKLGFDGWILKPIDFKRLRTILRGVVDTVQRGKDVYHPSSSNWEIGGWLRNRASTSEAV